MFLALGLSFVNFNFYLKDSKYISVASCMNKYMLLRQILKQHSLYPLSLFFIIFLIIGLKNAIWGKLTSSRINSNSFCIPRLLKMNFQKPSISYARKSEFLVSVWREFQVPVFQGFFYWTQKKQLKVEIPGTTVN